MKKGDRFGGPLFCEQTEDQMRVNVTWRNDNPNTIWNKLAAKLGREPTNEEAKAEVQRILRG